jgi:aminoglycoside phosphotransferase (APT) family kinase protein
MATDRPLVPLDRLTAYLDEHGIGSGPVELTAIGDGRSNATFRLKRGGADLVLRRPPAGPIAPRTHDVVREARVADGLAAAAVPVPRVVTICGDATVIGAPFALTGHLDGVVISAAFPPGWDTDVRRVASEAVADTLAVIHAVDLDAAGLTGLGRPTGYLERQIELYLRLWEGHRTRELPLVAEVGRRMRAKLPPSRRTTLVHGDYRLGNVMFDRRSPAPPLAVLDWELATVADPLVDLGYLCACWTEDGDDPDSPWQPDPATREAGCLSRAELVARYEQRSGRSMSSMPWYMTLALWKSAVFLEGSYRRRLAGTTDDPFFDLLEKGVPQIAERAWRVAQG